MVDIVMPDGTVMQNVPDGTPPEAIFSAWKSWQTSPEYKAQRQSRIDALKAQNPAEYDPSSSAYQEQYSPVSSMGAGQRFAAGAGKAFVDLGRGAGQLLGLVDNEDVAQSRELDAPLIDTTAGKFGNFTGNVVAAAPVAFVPGANTVAGAGLVGAGLGLLQPATSATERAANTAIGGVLGAGGQKAGQMIGNAARSRSAAKASAAAEAQAENAVRDATMRDGMKAGYVLPPSTINPSSALARNVDSVGGKAAVGQEASLRNQRVTNRLIREDLGLQGARQTTEAELEAVRQQAGQVYNAVAKSGRIRADQQYLNDIANLSNVIDDVAADFPGATAPSADKIRVLTDSLFQTDFDAATAVKYVRSLREQAKAGFKAVNSQGGNAETLALARAQSEAAGILEDAILRNLRNTGRGDLADSFERARILIAKSHNAEAALTPGSGNIDATKIGGDLRRGKPLGGNFELVGRFANAFRTAVREPQGAAGVSYFDPWIALGGLVGSSTGQALDSGLLTATGTAVAALPLLARPGARNIGLSGRVQQRFIPNYLPRNTLLDLTAKSSPFTGPVAIGLGNTE